MKKILVLGIVLLMGIATFPIINANDNHPPNKPILTGPSSGEAGKSYTYTAVSTDPDGDKIYYCFDWGDGEEFCSNMVNSGQEMKASHIWKDKGSYTIKVTATDEHGAESEPAALTVKMPYFYPINKFRIIKPRNGIYLFGMKIMPIFGQIVIGNINVKVKAPDYIKTVDFYLPLTCSCGLKETHIDTRPPFEWAWNTDYNDKEVKDEGLTEIIVKGYDSEYNEVSDNVMVYKVMI